MECLPRSCPLSPGWANYAIQQRTPSKPLWGGLCLSPGVGPEVQTRVYVTTEYSKQEKNTGVILAAE